MLPGGHRGHDVASDVQPHERLGEVDVSRGGGGEVRRCAPSGLMVHLPANGGKDTNSAWSDLDGDERMEARFLQEYAELLEVLLEGFEPQLEH